MKILFIANRVPFPPYRGDKLKIFNLGKQLRDSHELHLLAIAQSKEDLGHKEELLKIFKTVEFTYLPKWRSAINACFGIFWYKPIQVAYFHSYHFRMLLTRRLRSETYDAIHVQHLRMAQYLDRADRSHAILDLPDAFSLYWKRRIERGSWFRNIFQKLEYSRLKRYEKQVLPTFPLNLVCSGEDLEYLKNETGATLALLPNGVDTEQFAPRPGAWERNRILFTGNMDYAPNVDGVEHFCKNIFPQVLKAIPEARFIIAGQRPVSSVLALARPHVEVTGFIENLADEYARAHLVVAPLRFGAGTQNKVLEAMAMGIPVVCTHVGFEGLGVQSGEGIFCETEEKAFADRVVQIMKDDELRQNLSLKAHSLISEKFSWKGIAGQLEGYFLGGR